MVVMIEDEDDDQQGLNQLSIYSSSQMISGSAGDALS